MTADEYVPSERVVRACYVDTASPEGDGGPTHHPEEED